MPGGIQMPGQLGGGAISPVPQGGSPAGGGGGIFANIFTRIVNIDETVDTYADDVVNRGDVVTEYKMQNRFIRDPHTYMSGITSPLGFNGGAAAFVRLAADTVIMVCDWTACRAATKPKVPDPNVGGGWVFLFAMPETAERVVMPDGKSSLWRISGVYVYAKINPAVAMYDDVAWPLPQYLKDNDPRDVPNSLLTSGLLTIPPPKTIGLP